MMRFIPSVIFLLCCFFQSGQAAYSVALRSAAFFPMDSRFTHIYGDVNASYQVEVAKRFCNCYQFWLNVDEFYRSGKLSQCGRSKLNILTLSLGPKYVFPFSDSIDLYIGAGLAVAWARVHNCDVNREYNTSVGLALKSGANIFICNQLFLDLFFDYNYQPAFHNRTDIGGIKLGIGVGYEF